MWKCWSPKLASLTLKVKHIFLYLRLWQKLYKMYKKYLKSIIKLKGFRKKIKFVVMFLGLVWQLIGAHTNACKKSKTVNFNNILKYKSSIIILKWSKKKKKYRHFLAFTSDKNKHLHSLHILFYSVSGNLSRVFLCPGIGSSNPQPLLRIEGSENEWTNWLIL